LTAVGILEETGGLSMARKKPVSIKAARKKKQKTIVAYTKPEGDDWKPDTWKQLWRTLYDAALPYMLEYIQAEQRQAA
jgi:hypothetical protein